MRNRDLSDLLHSFLALFLLLKQLALPANVPAVALGSHVLAQRLHRAARNDLSPNRGLNRYLKHLPVDNVLELLSQLLSAIECLVAVHDDA